MTKYIVPCWCETIDSFSLEVEADNKIEAVLKAKEMLNNPALLSDADIDNLVNNADTRDTTLYVRDEVDFIEEVKE